MLRVGEQAARSDTGRQRSANEDSYYARAPLFAIADGMGGAQAGEVASRIAVECLEGADPASEPPEAFLRQLVELANERIHEVAAGDSTRSGMGTTLTAALLVGEEVSLAHVGDSRAYVFRDGELRMLSTDHSLVEELRRQGRLTEEQAVDHPQRSIITRALGPEDEVEVDTMTFRGRPGDVYLLCSDGLTTMLRDERIVEILAGEDELDEKVKRLVREANDAGGRDNITVVCFALEEIDAPALAEGETLVGPSAEQAGLTGERVREEVERSRAARRPSGRSEPAPRREPTAEVGRRSRLRSAVKAVLALVVIAAICAAAVLGARQVHFLGGDEGGRLTLFRGLPYELPFGIELYSEVSSLPVLVDSLPEDRRDEATNHELRSEDDARDLLADLERSVAEPEPEPGPRDPGGDRGGGGRGDGGRGGGSGDRDRAGGAREDRRPGGGSGGGNRNR